MLTEPVLGTNHLMGHIYKLIFRSYGFLLIWAWTMVSLQTWTKHGQELGWGKLEADLTS